MKFDFEVNNIKCGGCVSNIKNHLQQDARISNIEVDIDTGRVSFESETDARVEWSKLLTDLGYPEK